MVGIEQKCKMWSQWTYCLFFLLLIRFPKYMHTDSSVGDGNVNAGQGENDEKKEQGRKVKCLCFVLYTPVKIVHFPFYVF